MTGLFAEWQPRYAAVGIATFPVGEAKKPKITGWQKVGLKGSAELATKFTDADALGYVTGRRSKVTVLDIDTTDETVAEDAIRRHGMPGIIKRTASGKLHLLYRYNGERRQIRPWPGLPIDILGDNGFALAAPSRLAKGAYEIIRGHLDDIGRLPVMVRPKEEALPTVIREGKPLAWTELRDGNYRNRALWERCMRMAPQCAGFEQLFERAQRANQQFREPIMEQAVIEKTARSAWRYTEDGMNFFLRPRVMLDHEVFDTLRRSNPDALLLLMTLERHHGGNDTFIMARTMATQTMGWTLRRWRIARGFLEQSGIIKCINPGGRGPHDPPRYIWGTRGL
jgi:hypothetical protein